MDILNRLREWKAKGELCYLAKASGLDWGDIEDVCRGGRILAMRWAKSHGKVWPIVGLEVFEPVGEAEVVVSDDRKTVVISERARIRGGTSDQIVVDSNYPEKVTDEIIRDSVERGNMFVGVDLGRDDQSIEIVPLAKVEKGDIVKAGNPPVIVSPSDDMGLPLEKNYPLRDDWLYACLKVVSESEGTEYEDPKLLCRDFISWGLAATLKECEAALIRNGVKKKK